MKKITGISDVKVIKEFTDDHMAAVEIEFKDQDGQLHTMEIFNLESHVAIGAAPYANESATARRLLIEIINEQIEEDCDE